MALRNLNFDSAIRGILAANTSVATGMLIVATEQLAKCGLKFDLAHGSDHPARHKRGPEAGQFKGSDCFNERNILDWIESVPATVPAVLATTDPEYGISKEVAAASDLARKQLIKIHATLAKMNPVAWDKLKAGAASVPVPLA